MLMASAFGPIRKVLSQFAVHLAQMPGSQRAPVFLVRVRTQLPLNGGDGFIDFLNGFASPGFDVFLPGPILAEEKFFAHFQTIATERRSFDFSVHIAGVIMFAVAAEAEQARDEQLRAVTFTRVVD